MKRFSTLLVALSIALGALGGSVSAGEIKAEVVTRGEYGEVSSIMGNGTGAQGAYTVEGPRNLAYQSGKIYFVDGTHERAKLRVYDGKKNTTLVNLVTDEVAAKNSEFFVSTGVAVVDREVFISSHRELYLVKSSKSKGNYLTRVPKVKDYMKKNGFDYIYRMESMGNDLYFMLAHKSRGYGFIKYSAKTKSVEQVLEVKTYPSGPNNFYVDREGILIAFQSGIVRFESFFPRKSVDVIRTNEGAFVDMWTGKDGYLYYIENRDRVKWIIGQRHRKNTEDESLLAGGRRGYVDGLLDQVEMDGATDFVWDGSGYLFADKGNHAIRKVWLDSGPTSIVK